MIRRTWTMEERLRGQNQRAKQAGARHDLTMEQWLETLEYFDHKCALCLSRKMIENKKTLNVQPANVQRSTFNVSKLLEKLSVRLDAPAQIKRFSCRQHSRGFQYNLLFFMICRFVVTCQTSLIDKLPAQRFERRRHFIFRVNRMERTFGHTRAAVNASGRVNIICRKLGGCARLDGFHRAHLRTSIVAQT